MKQEVLLEEYKRIQEIKDIDYSGAAKYFKSVYKHYLPLQDGIANKDNFFDSTVVMFREVDKPKRKADFESPSGSCYWFSKEGVIRGSDHWGNRVMNCDWAICLKNGRNNYGHSAFSTTTFAEEKYGFAKWEAFVLKSELLEIEGKEMITTFENKLGRNIFLVENKAFERKYLVTYEPIKLNL